ncbi:MAG: sugar nucleotide-binding protein, partial [Polyangiaceae bacterium]|nr:sugar nucleotide-binding protein [Polyangiaceae bacterium]
MRVFLTGGGGQLGRALRSLLPEGDVVAPPSRDVDVTDARAVAAAIAAARPDVILHCAAMTDVDLCEAARARAFAVNAGGAASVAAAARRAGARLVAVSTD